MRDLADFYWRGKLWMVLSRIARGYGAYRCADAWLWTAYRHLRPMQ